MLVDVTRNLVINEDARNWCKLPYPNHPKGCPRYGNKEDCPPRVPVVSKVFNLIRQHWFIIIKFNLKAHVQKKKLKFPNWSDRQCRCCLYWQGTVRARLKKECKDFIEKRFNHIYTLIPEAMGVDVFKTLNLYGVRLKKHPIDIIYKVALVGMALTTANNLANTKLQTQMKI